MNLFCCKGGTGAWAKPPVRALSRRWLAGEARVSRLLAAGLHVSLFRSLLPLVPPASCLSSSHPRWVTH